MTFSEARERELAVAVDAVRSAATLCEAVRTEMAAAALEKQDRSPVTIADYGSQALICHAIRDHFPDDPIVAEESAEALRDAQGQDLRDPLIRYVERVERGATLEVILDWIDHGTGEADSDRFWTLDPIDGTKGFLRNDQYAVALALVERGEVRVAALACPNLQHEEPGQTGVLFLAIAGEGAYSASLRMSGEPVRVSTGPAKEPEALRFCESVESAHSSHGHAAQVATWLGIVQPPVRMDSQAKYGAVARGDADIYLRMPRGTTYKEKIWDHAAGALVVHEAGGRVTDLRGKPLDFTRGRTLESNYGIVVTGGAVHARVLEALEATGMV